jgi:hypothetical protein
MPLTRHPNHVPIKSIYNLVGAVECWDVQIIGSSGGSQGVSSASLRMCELKYDSD